MRNCPVCKSSKKKFIIHQEFYPIFERNLSYDLVACKDCGVVYANNSLNQAVYNNYYKKIAKYDEHSSDGYVSQGLQKAHLRTFKIVSRFLPSKNLAVLDIGCATGNLLKNFKINGYTNLFGIDPVPGCKEAAKKLYNIEIQTAALNEFRTKRKFNLILLSNVLEHFYDVRENLDIIKRLSKPNTLIYVELPAAHKIHQALCEPFGQFSPEHLNFFSSISLENLMGIAGFEKVYLKIQKNKENIHAPYPVITSVWRRTSVPKKIKHDKSLLESVTAYIALSKNLNKKINKKINKLVKFGPIIVWGAGAHTARLLATTNFPKMNIKAIVDNNKNLWGKKVHRLAVRSPETIKNTTYPILVSSFVFQSEIAQAIRNHIKSYQKIITLY